ncbi:MAG: hypothetical protein OEZ13_12935 [Spirochaetia bacterium]|nr:hypothetical protein [Spirochaetia bacterium]
MIYHFKKMGAYIYVKSYLEEDVWDDDIVQFYVYINGSVRWTSNEFEVDNVTSANILLDYTKYAPGKTVVQNADGSVTINEM